MGDPSLHYPQKTEMMSPRMDSFPPTDMNSFPHFSFCPQSSPSFQHQFYMNWGMNPYIMYNPNIQQYSPPSQPFLQNQIVPSDPFPSLPMTNPFSFPVNNENIPPSGEMEKESRGGPISQRKRVKTESTKKRNVFSTAQTNALGILFEKMNNLMKTEREELGEAIGLTQNQIKIWLQNRRYKENKMNTQPIDPLKNKRDYDMEKAKNAVREAVNEYKSFSANSLNGSAQFYPY